VSVLLDENKITAQILDKIHDFCETPMISNSWKLVSRLIINCNQTVLDPNNNHIHIFEYLTQKVNNSKSAVSFIEEVTQELYTVILRKSCLFEITGYNEISTVVDIKEVGKDSAGDTESKVSSSIRPDETIKMLQLLGKDFSTDEVVGVVYDATKKAIPALNSIVASNSSLIHEVVGVASLYDSATGTLANSSTFYDEDVHDKFQQNERLAKQPFTAKVTDSDSSELFQARLTGSKPPESGLSIQFIEEVQVHLNKLNEIFMDSATIDAFITNANEYIKGLQVNPRFNDPALFELLNHLFPSGLVDDSITFKEAEINEILLKLNFVRKSYNVKPSKKGVNSINNSIFVGVNLKKYLEFMFGNENGKQLPKKKTVSGTSRDNNPYAIFNDIGQLNNSSLQNLLLRICIFAPDFLKTNVVFPQQAAASSIEFPTTSSSTFTVTDQDVPLDQLTISKNLEGFISNLNDILEIENTTLEFYQGEELVGSCNKSSVTSVSRKARELLCMTFLQKKEKENYLLTDIEKKEKAVKDDESKGANRADGISDSISHYTNQALIKYIESKKNKEFEKSFFFCLLGKTYADLLQGLLTKYLNERKICANMVLTMDKSFATILLLEDIPFLFERPLQSTKHTLQIFPGSLIPEKVMKDIVSQVVKDSQKEVLSLGIDVGDGARKETCQNLLYRCALEKYKKITDSAPSMDIECPLSPPSFSVEPVVGSSAKSPRDLTSQLTKSSEQPDDSKVIDVTNPFDASQLLNSDGCDVTNIEWNIASSTPLPTQGTLYMDPLSNVIKIRVSDQDNYDIDIRNLSRFTIKCSKKIRIGGSRKNHSKRKQKTRRTNQSNTTKHSIRHKQKRRRRTYKQKSVNDDLYDNLLIKNK
jgi:hypothetical protein